ncbi:MAG: AAA family ATPase [Polyangiaceae bacterium]
MLTRLRVTGFKNLDVDVQLGPFTCIAGPNGVGKSNFFDAIAFLSALAAKPLLEAALEVRGGAGRMGDVRGLFRRVGDRHVEEMSFLAEMIIRREGEDQLGQVAEASITYLRYQLGLRYRAALPSRPNGGIEIVSESLSHLKLTEAARRLGFATSKGFRESCLQGRRTTPYISTKDFSTKDISTKEGFVSLHADSKGGKGGGQRVFRSQDLPRTVLSSTENAMEHPTATLARREMLSWTQLHLEPSALRAPDDFTAPPAIGHNGAHLPATLYRLASDAAAESSGADQNVYSRVANRLSMLVEQVRSIAVDVDEKRQLLSIIMTESNGTPHLASSLSDGTLRFLALAVMNEERHPRSLLCLEEPENGMHPSRIPAMLRLLSDLAVDPEEPVNPDNPLRQVLINTHSPGVVAEVPEDALLVARLIAGPDNEDLATLAPLPDTWRTSELYKPRTVPKGELLAYLNPIAPLEHGEHGSPNSRPAGGPGPRRVKDRPDLQPYLPGLEDSIRAAE